MSEKHLPEVPWKKLVYLLPSPDHLETIEREIAQAELAGSAAK